MTSSVTAMVEAHEAKGSGWTTCTRLDDFTDETGSEAAANAIAAIGGRRVPTGDYTVIFGRQPVADLLNNLVLPACHAGAFYASSTPFLGKLGRAGRRARARHLRSRRPARPHRIQGHHVRGLADGAHRPDQGRRARRAPEPLVRRPAAPARSARRRQARRGRVRRPRARSSRATGFAMTAAADPSSGGRAPPRAM